MHVCVVCVCLCVHVRVCIHIHTCISSPMFQLSCFDCIFITMCSVFEHDGPAGMMESKVRLRHDNHTGRWLTNFRAVWDSKNEDYFVVGSMARPRQVCVCACAGTCVCVRTRTCVCVCVCV